MKGKTDEASSVLVMEAKFNGTVLPAGTLDNDQPVDQYNENKASETTHVLSQKGKCIVPHHYLYFFHQTYSRQTFSYGFYGLGIHFHITESYCSHLS